MKTFNLFSMAFASLLTLGTLTTNAQSLSPSTKWHWNKGKIVIETPERPAGQKDVLNLRLPKMKTVRVGFVGLGMRGPSAVADFCLIPGVQIVALCDFEQERAEKQNELLRKNGLAPAAVSLKIRCAYCFLSQLFVFIGLIIARFWGFVNTSEP